MPHSTQRCACSLSRTILSLGIMCFLMQSAAQAGFILNGYFIPAASNGGYNAFVVSAFNDGNGGSGSKLASFDVEVRTSGSSSATALRVNFRDVDGDGVNDANMLGSGLSFTNSSQFILGTFGRIGTIATFNYLLVEPGPITTDSDGDGVADRSYAAAFNNLHSIRIAGFANTPANADTGAGAPFFVVVVPTGNIFQATIGLGSETAFGQTFNLNWPEPGTAYLMATIGIMALGKRRRGSSQIVRPD